MKEDILRLREEGLSYRDIQSKLGCSKGLISYHCGKGQKEKVLNRTRLRRASLHPLEYRFEGFNSGNKIRSFRHSVRNCNRDVYVSGSFTKKEFLDKFLNSKCYLTGRNIDFNDTKSFEIDHIIPVSKGGSNELSNAEIACKDANQSKGSMLLEDYLLLCREVLENFGYKVSRI